jgi:hypothetical protein
LYSFFKDYFETGQKNIKDWKKTAKIPKSTLGLFHRVFNSPFTSMRVGQNVLENVL